MCIDWRNLQAHSMHKICYIQYDIYEGKVRNMNFKKLQSKVRDFKTYGAILTALSSFFYIGTLLPKDGITAVKVEIMQTIVFTLLIAAFGFFMLSNHFNRKLQNEEQM
jgi:hypothetical protein